MNIFVDYWIPIIDNDVMNKHTGRLPLCVSYVNIRTYRHETLTEAVVFFRSSVLWRGHLVSATFTLCLPLPVLVCTQWTRLASLTINHLSSGAVSYNTKETSHKTPALALESVYVGGVMYCCILDCPYSAFEILYKLIHRRDVLYKQAAYFLWHFVSYMYV